MIISIKDIVSVPDKTMNESCEIEQTSINNRGFEYPIVKKTPVTFYFHNEGRQKIYMEASFEVHLSIPCDRCLEEVVNTYPVKIQRSIDFSEDADEEQFYDLGYIDRENMSLDVDRLVYEELLVLIPIQVLCKESCKGICSVCGANLNLGDCGCDRHVPDPRMAAIRDIFNNFKEV